MSVTGSPAFTRVDAERYAMQLNESYIGPGPYKAAHSAVEGAWYVSKSYDGREVARIYQRIGNQQAEPKSYADWQQRRGMAADAIKPFSTYPEDHDKLLDLARKCERSDDANAVELGDLVRAILEDEAVAAKN